MHIPGYQVKEHVVFSSQCVAQKLPINFPPVKRESNVITKQRLAVILNVHWQELIIKLGSFFIAASLLLI